MLKYLGKFIMITRVLFIRHWGWISTYIKFKLNGVEIKGNFISFGVPILSISLYGRFKIGSGLSLNNGSYSNMIGRQQSCYFIVSKKAILTIGNNVGISCSAIVCHQEITIEDNVKIGGNVCIYDTDFHSLNVFERSEVPENITNVNTKPVRICSGSFIGGHSIILKGVTIGENAIVGAGSVVSKDIPANEIWGGNPAGFLKRITN